MKALLPLLVTLVVVFVVSALRIGEQQSRVERPPGSASVAEPVEAGRVASKERAPATAASKPLRKNHIETAKTALHPSVRYQNPERIRSFSDPKLASAFEVMFSLIGDAADKFRYGSSAFDSKYNSDLAYHQLSQPVDAKNRDSWRANLLAATHLTRSDLEVSEQRVSALADQWIEDIEKSPAGPEREIRALDLEILVASEADRDWQVPCRRYREARSPLLRNTIARVLEDKLTKRGYDAEQIRVELAKEQVSPSDMSGARVVSLKGSKT